MYESPRVAHVMEIRETHFVAIKFHGNMTSTSLGYWDFAQKPMSFKGQMARTSLRCPQTWLGTPVSMEVLTGNIWYKWAIDGNCPLLCLIAEGYLKAGPSSRTRCKVLKTSLLLHAPSATFFGDEWGSWCWSLENQHEPTENLDKDWLLV